MSAERRNLEMKKSELPYDFSKREIYWQRFWNEEQIYHFDPESQQPLYTIDTPPPTVSGFLHLGHVFSYTQAEVVARYKRMAGYNVRYPFGLDNNGLPTERLVEKEKGIKGEDFGLRDFAEICMEVTEKYKKEFKDLWKSLGFSYDWRLEYSTISPGVQRISQSAFKELFDKGLIYRKEAPALYCHECHTSVAQAEVEDSDRESVFYNVAFKDKRSKDFIISTTRPELLPACAAVFVHPDDARYKDLIGEEVETPLGQKVKVIADKKVAIDKGSGAVMCCTYGDETDVAWTREYKLPEKIIIDAEGMIEGKSIIDSRTSIIFTLKEMGAVKDEKPITHAVGVHERCGTPIEILSITQWFVRILDMKNKLIEAGEKIHWYPAYMEKRYTAWVEGLKWDWCISRERFFGVPIPAYICTDCSEVTVPDVSSFPIDPKASKEKLNCDHCHGGNLKPERAVLDTWFTSALTPDVNNASSLNGQLEGKMYPMSMRPQAHDIIRTWAVYSILMGLYRHNNVPWKDLMISGHVLVKKGEKISKKTGGGKYKPEELIGEHSADAIRYAMCTARLGRDAYYDEAQVKDGKKLVIKLYNAGKFVLRQLDGFKPQNAIEGEDLEAIDKWIIYKLGVAAKNMQSQFERYEVGQALKAFEDFFWKDFTDYYLEMVKGRLYGQDAQKRLSAQSALYTTFLGVLKLASPFVPHITEEIYHSRVVGDALVSDNKGGILMATGEGTSIHITGWPTGKSDKSLEEIDRGAASALAIISEVRKYKTANKIRLGEPMGRIVIKADEEVLSSLEGFVGDIVSTSRASEVVLANKDYDDQPDDHIISL